MIRSISYRCAILIRFVVFSSKSLECLIFEFCPSAFCLFVLLSIEECRDHFDFKLLNGRSCHQSTEYTGFKIKEKFVPTAVINYRGSITSRDESFAFISPFKVSVSSFILKLEDALDVDLEIIHDRDRNFDICLFQALRLKVEVGEQVTTEEISKTLLCNMSDDVKSFLGKFIHALYNFYVDLYFTYLEINPLVVTSKGIHVLDVAAKLDQAAEYLCSTKWGKIDFPAPFGREAYPEVRTSLNAFCFYPCTSADGN